jgi:hypothetical protein
LQTAFSDYLFVLKKQTNKQSNTNGNVENEILEMKCSIDQIKTQKKVSSID